MNPHYKKVVDIIQAKHAGETIGYLIHEPFVNKYFSEAEFNEEILTDKVRKEFDRRLKVALEEAVEALNIRRNLLLLSVPFAYFFGSIFRDFTIDYRISTRQIYEGHIEIYIWWFLWVVFFLWPLNSAYKIFEESKTIRDYLRIELESNSPSGKQVASKVIIDEGHDSSSRLRELDKLLNEGLISQSEYDKKRKLIIKDL